MIGKIISISDSGFSYKGVYLDKQTYDGYKLTLDDGKKILVGVDDNSSCCENWGYVSSEDNLQDFIGASVISVDVVDSALNVKAQVEIYEGSAMFVNINTDRGLFQLVVYNAHNGYYSHDAVLVVADELRERTYL